MGKSVVVRLCLPSSHLGLRAATILRLFLSNERSSSNHAYKPNSLPVSSPALDPAFPASRSEGADTVGAT